MARRKPGFEAIREALLTETGIVPTPVVVEYERVMALADNAPNADARLVLAEILDGPIAVAALDAAATQCAVDANAEYGRGSGHAAKLNIIDLMVYGMAKARDLPILSTGADFAATDAGVHPASRVG